MYNSIKLATVNKIIFIFLLLVGVLLVSSSAYILDNVEIVNSAWNSFNEERSDKARLEGSLSSAIGYGGMIHQFKNIILYRDLKQASLAQSSIGAANAIINQYFSLELNRAEQAGLNDIKSALNEYKKSLALAVSLIKKNKSPQEIDKLVKVNDELAFRGLNTLRHEVQIKSKKLALPSKSRLSADLRAALGYGGMIHHFKNYQLRNDKKKVSIIEESINKAKQVIKQFNKHKLTSGEQLALNDILKTINNYQSKLNTAKKEMAQTGALVKFNKSVIIDDKIALRGFEILNKEAYIQIANNDRKVSSALYEVKNLIEMKMWFSIVVIMLLLLLVAFTMNFSIVKPIKKLTLVMDKLSHNNLETPVPYVEQENEIGQISRSIGLTH